MRQAIRALGWAINIFWAILLFFTITSVYSALQIRPGFGEPYTTASGSSLIASLPFYISNGGFYDLTNLNVTTQVKDNIGNPISDSSTFIATIPHGRNVTGAHDMAISMENITSNRLSHLLFNDSVLNVDIALKLDYANVVPFKISTNFTMPWGAPLNNLTVSNISAAPYNMTHARITVLVSFENHSYLGLNGAMRLELVNFFNQVVGSGSTDINVPSRSGYGGSIEVLSSSNVANVREARLYFQTSVLTYGPVVISLV
jgi:hypothetical protein